ncbi:MarC family protein [Streptomyces violaceorubidus]
MTAGGHQILDYLHVSVPAMIAGGCCSWRSTCSPASGAPDGRALVPLGMPLLAGPGASSVILAVQKADSVTTQVSVWAAILAIHVVLWLVMRYSLLIIRVIKDGGVVLVTRLAGMMLSAIAVQQIINGVTQVIQGA